MNTAFEQKESNGLTDYFSRGNFQKYANIKQEAEQ